MRKSVWLLSAGAVRCSRRRHLRQTAPSTTDTDKQTAQPTAGATAEAAAVAGPGARAAAGRHRRHRHHRDAPQPGPVRTFRSRSARSPPRSCRIPARPTSASSTSSPRRCSSPRPASEAERLGPYPRHRHGRRQPGLESSVAVFIDGVYRSRSRHRPQRARRARPDRSAARSAGHPVRPQRLGRPHLHHHQASRRFDFGGLWRSDDRQLRPSPRSPAASPAPLTDTLAAPARRRLRQARRLLRRRQPTTPTINDRNRFFTRGQLLFEPNDDAHASG